MSDVKEVSKTNLDRVLQQYNVYTNKYDAQNQTNSVSPLPQWWGDDNRELELDFDTGLVTETQENGEKVGMGYLDENAIKAIKRNKDLDAAALDQQRAKDMDDKRMDQKSELYRDWKKTHDDNGDTKSNIVKMTVETTPVEQGAQPTSNKAARVAATGGAVVTGVLEGVGAFGETLVDAASVVSGAAATPITGVTDGVEMVGKKLFTDKDWETIWNETKSDGVTATLWNNTKGFVAKKWVSNFFDDIYNETAAGQAIKNNAYGFNYVRTGGKVGGEIIGIVALTLLTMGIGTAAAGGASAAGAGTEIAVVGAGAGTEVALTGAGAVGAVSTSGAAAAGTTAAGGIVTSANVFTALSAASGFGEGAEDSWSQGGSTAQGLAEATAKGTLNAILSRIGIKNIQSTIPKAGKIALGGVIGGAGAAANPVTSAIGHGTTYGEEFEKAGGVKSVVTGAVVGAGATAIAVKGTKTTVEPYGEGQPANNVKPVGAIEEKAPAFEYEPNTQPKVGGATAGETLGIEGPTAQGATGTTSTGATSTSAATGATGNTGIPKVTFNEETQAAFEAARKSLDSGRGGVSNITPIQLERIAKSLNMTPEELINMKPDVYRSIMNQAHPDISGINDVGDILRVIKAIYSQSPYKTSGH